MENFEELQKAIEHLSKVNEYIKRVKSIGFIGRYESKEYIGITDHYNMRYTFEGVVNIIGEEKLKSIVDQFQGLINVELQKVKEKSEKELSKYRVVKNEL